MPSGRCTRKTRVFRYFPLKLNGNAIFEVTRKLKEIKLPNFAVRLVARGRACLQSADRLVTSPTSERRQRFPYMFYIEMHWSVNRCAPVAVCLGTGSNGAIRWGPSGPTCMPSLSAPGRAVWTKHAKNVFMDLVFFRAKYLPCKRVFL